MSGKECKELALKSLKGNYLNAIVTILIYGAIISALSVVTGGIGTFLLSSLLLIAFYNVYIEGYKKNKYEINNMFKGLEKGISNRICLSVLKNLYIFLWTLLFIIPGIVKSYSYFLTEFISREDPSKTASECVDESRKLMNGHKMDLFLFQLSFIGWMILGLFTLGILYIWLIPYMEQATIIYIDKNIYKLSVLNTENENISSKVNDPYEEVNVMKEENKEYKYCTECGIRVLKNANYCLNCGKKLNDEE